MYKIIKIRILILISAFFKIFNDLHCNMLSEHKSTLLHNFEDNETKISKLALIVKGISKFCK